MFFDDIITCRTHSRSPRARRGGKSTNNGIEDDQLPYSICKEKGWWDLMERNMEKVVTKEDLWIALVFCFILVIMHFYGHLIGAGANFAAGFAACAGLSLYSSSFRYPLQDTH